MSTAAKVAEYIIYEAQKRKNPVTNTKLQKLLYFVQGSYLAKYNKLAFEDNIIAWKYGPVVKDIYYKYSLYGAEPIIVVDKLNSKISIMLSEIINIVLETFLNTSQTDLIEETIKRGSPWSYTDIDDTISVEDIKQYFLENYVKKRELNMLLYKIGDMLDSDADYIINTVNILGTSGKGLALQIKKQYPEAVIPYEQACKNKELDVGKILISNTRFNRQIIHFPTKRNWRDPSKYEYIEKGLIALVNFCNTIKTNNITIAIPQLGCGLGRLEWKQVLNLIRKYLGPIQHITFYIYGPKL